MHGRMCHMNLQPVSELSIGISREILGSLSNQEGNGNENATEE